MSVTNLIEFDDITEHTFDANFLTLLNDKGQLKSLVSANEILFANFDGLGDGSGGSPIELSRRGGKTITFGGVNNTGQVANGVLEFPILDRSTARYAGITSIVDDFAFRTKIKSNVTGVSTDRTLVQLKSNIDTSLVRFYFSNQGGGITRLRIQIVNSLGATISSAVLTTKNMTTDPDWEVALSNDNTGNILIHVDGVLRATIVSPTFDFTDCDFIFSDDGSGKTSVANYDDIQLFNANEIATPDVFPFPESTTYSKNEHVMITSLTQIVDELISIDVAHEIPTNTEMKFFGLFNGVSFWFDGAAWTISDRTLAQSNTLAEIQASISMIPIVKGIGKLMDFGSIFQSISGYDTPLIESATFKYKMSFKSGDINACIVTGTVKSNANEPVVGAKVTIQSDDRIDNNNLIGPAGQAVTNFEGKFSISVPETQTKNVPVTITYEYNDIDPGETNTFLETIEFKNKIIPNLPTAEIGTLPDFTG